MDKSAFCGGNSTKARPGAGDAGLGAEWGADCIAGHQRDQWSRDLDPEGPCFFFSLCSVTQ